MSFPLLVLLPALFAGVQSTPPPQPASVLAPQYRDQYVGVVQGRMVPLERVQPHFSMQHSSLPILVRTRGYQSISGPASPVRLPADTHFLVRMSTGGVDPLTLIHLQPLKPAKDDRQITTVVSQAIPVPIFQNGKTQHPADTTLSLTIQDRGDGVLEIAPSALLPPGEYAFMDGASAQCFGVDAGSASAGKVPPAASPAAVAPAAPPPAKPAAWNILVVPEIATTGQDVQQSTASLVGHDLLRGRRTEANLLMHCGFPATEYPHLFPLEVILGGTDEMFGSPAMPGAWLDLSSFAAMQLSGSPRVPVDAVSQNRTTGARVRFFLDAEDMQAVVDAPGHTLRLFLSDGNGRDATTAEFVLPQDREPLAEQMHPCLETRAAEVAAQQRLTVAACPAPRQGSFLNTVTLQYAASGKEVPGNFNEEDNGATWRLPVPAKGQQPRRTALICSYTGIDAPEAAQAAYSASIAVPPSARYCSFTVQQDTRHSAAVCTSSVPRSAASPGQR